MLKDLIAPKSIIKSHNKMTKKTFESKFEGMKCYEQLSNYIVKKKSKKKKTCMFFYLKGKLIILL